MPVDKSRAEQVTGIAVIASLITGLAGLIGALFAFFNFNWIGVGVCLIAAALAFGLVANAVLRS